MPSYVFSVIVPVYNMEKYLKRCIDSIIHQTYSNLEIILIDDGSTDSSSEIIDDYATIDPRIVVIHKPNGGIGSAYETAFRKISGDYVSFVDSDDYVDTEMYAQLAEIAAEKPADIIHFGWKMIDDQGEVFKSEIPVLQFLEGRDQILNAHFTTIKNPSLACRVFNSDLFKEVESSRRSFGVDETVYIQVISRCRSYLLVNKAYYFAYIRESSVSNASVSPRKLQEIMDVHRYVCDFVRKNMNRYEQYANLKYFKALEGALTASGGKKDLMKSGEYIEAKKDLQKYYYKIKKSEAINSESIRHRTSMMMINLSTNLYIRFLRLLGG